MDFKQKLLIKLNLPSFEKIEEDIDKHSLTVFGVGVGIGSLIGTFIGFLLRKK